MTEKAQTEKLGGTLRYIRLDYYSVDFDATRKQRPVPDYIEDRINEPGGIESLGWQDGVMTAPIFLIKGERLISYIIEEGGRCIYGFNSSDTEGKPSMIREYLRKDIQDARTNGLNGDPRVIIPENRQQMLYKIAHVLGMNAKKLNTDFPDYETKTA